GPAIWGEQTVPDLFGGPYTRSARPCAGRPAVSGVGHDDRPIAELHRVAGPAVHHLAAGGHGRRAAIGVVELVTDLDLTHRRPTVRRRQGSVQGERLAKPGSAGNDDELARVETVEQP